MSREPHEKPAPHRASPLPRPPRLPGITPAEIPADAGNQDTLTLHHQRTNRVSDPQITCTKCGTEIKLTESLAAPLIVAARKQFEAQLAAKEADVQPPRSAAASICKTISPSSAKPSTSRSRPS